eukprot:SAG22_NODE_7360_length_747_cov_1.729938_1_plen_157_part_10
MRGMRSFRLARPAAAGIAAAATAAAASSSSSSSSSACDPAGGGGGQDPLLQSAKREKTLAELYSESMAPGTNTFPPLQADRWEPNWDGRAPPASAPSGLRSRLRKAPTRHLILIRHGQYDLDSETDPPLTALGKLQATKTGEHLAKWGIGAQFKPDP